MPELVVVLDSDPPHISTSGPSLNIISNGNVSIRIQGIITIFGGAKCRGRNSIAAGDRRCLKDDACRCRVSAADAGWDWVF